MKVVLRTECPYCKRRGTVQVESEPWLAWTHRRLLIQEAFPELSPAQREQLLTGICDPCWQREMAPSDTPATRASN